MGFVNSTIIKNYLTTLFGVLAGLPLLVAGSGIVLSPAWNHRLLVAAGIGSIGLGVVSKAFNVHATQDEVEAATMKAQLDAKKP